MPDLLTCLPIPVHPALTQAGRAADDSAARAVFADYRLRLSPHTVRRHEQALRAFAGFLSRTTGQSVDGAALATRPEYWAGITFGLVDAFVKDQVLAGYAVGTINGRLTVLQTYAALATRAGALPAPDGMRIRLLRTYRGSEGRRLNEARARAGLPTRRGAKKSAPVIVDRAAAAQLLARPDSPQGRRDRLLLCLLLEQGLRAGEAATLPVDAVDLARGTLTFFRPKVGKRQTHRLTAPTLAAARAYLEQDGAAAGPLLRASKKNGALLPRGCSPRAIAARVHNLGARLGLPTLSAHDLRHTWATNAARAGTPVDRLQEAGGWSSPAMPLHYVAAAHISNEGVVLEED